MADRNKPAQAKTKANTKTKPKTKPATKSTTAPKQQARLALTLRLMQEDEIAIGPGKADLLDAIEHTGSISGAARALGMSYRRAWLLVDVMNRRFRAPLVHSATGGQQGGGASVTEEGVRVRALFRAMQAAALAAAAPHGAALAALLRPSAERDEAPGVAPKPH